MSVHITKTYNIDSVIQAAGRCNREGIEKKENSKVYIFDINGMKTVPGQSLQSSITKGLLARLS